MKITAKDCYELKIIDQIIEEPSGGAHRHFEKVSSDLKKRIHSDHLNPTDKVVVRFDCDRLDNEQFQIVQNLSEILQDSGEIGISEVGIFNIEIKSLQSREKELIRL